MTQLEFCLGISGLWIASAWMPYILERFVSRGVMGTFANPSPDLPRQAPWAQRAKAAHKVAVETFAAFGPLAVFALIKIPGDHLVGLFALTYLLGLLAHNLIYCLGIPVLRTIAFLVASLSTAAIGLRVLGWI